eukprot:8426438-Alexandrium_andersonii.AAC.1
MKSRGGHIPKHHFAFHASDDAEYWGNPKLWSCWVEEGLNATLKAVSRGCHALRFETRIFEKFEGLNLEAAAPKRKRGL